jgi:hypothetical protein
VEGPRLPEFNSRIELILGLRPIAVTIAVATKDIISTITTGNGLENLQRALAERDDMLSPVFGAVRL